MMGKGKGVKVRESSPPEQQDGDVLSPDTPRPPVDLYKWLSTFERRTYISFVSRARASKRLEVRGILWMISLSVASATALCASVFSLATADRPVSQIDLTVALFSLATLVLSLIVSVLNYAARSRDLFHSFRAVQTISSQAESLRLRVADLKAIEAALLKLEEGYQAALDKSENHTTFDYHRARPAREEKDKKREDVRLRRSATLFQGAVTALPISIIIASLLWLIMVFAGRS